MCLLQPLHQVFSILVVGTISYQLSQRGQGAESRESFVHAHQGIYYQERLRAYVYCRCVCSFIFSSQKSKYKARNPDLSQIPQSQFQSSLSCRPLFLIPTLSFAQKVNKYPKIEVRVGTDRPPLFFIHDSHAAFSIYGAPSAAHPQLVLPPARRSRPVSSPDPTHPTLP